MNCSFYPRGPDCLFSTKVRGARIHTSLRRLLFLYLLGLIIGLQLAFVLEMVFAVDLHYYAKLALLATVIPCFTIWLGMRFGKTRIAVLPKNVWLTNFIVLFLFWAGGYFLTGFITANRSFASLMLPFERHIPFVSETVFVYVTVYPLFLLPLLLLEDPKELAAYDIAQVAGLTVSYVTYIVFPVSFPRESVEIVNFSTFVVSILHSADPAWNCFPSTHCTTCSIAAVALWRYDTRLGIWAILSTFAICLSTLFTKQHYVVDVVAGVGIGLVFYCTAIAVISRVEKLPFFSFVKQGEQ